MEAGAVHALIGTNGSGKTTLLNVIAGWERPDAGAVERLGSTVIPDWSDLAVVPQRLGLLEELTVRENIEYPSRLAGRLAELQGRVDELIWMGGALEVEGNVQQPGHDGSAEWNVYWDPPAARRVFATSAASGRN